MAYSESLITGLKELDALKDTDEIKNGMLERIEPTFVEQWPVGLNKRVVEALAAEGIHRPYQHQADAIEASLRGQNVVLESPTASGKTLAFIAPMLHTLLTEPDSHALMIYPMKALAFDQREQIRSFAQHVAVDSWPYDGDTDEEHKRYLRQQPPRILLTNPEYLNHSFLAYNNVWETFLKKLRYVVIDEMHEYRGFFGSNMALLLRRFFLHLNTLGATPKVMLSTATCANPAEHAKNLIGHDVTVVSARNSISPKRHFLFVKPDIPDFQFHDILRVRIANAALAVARQGHRALIFCPTKRFLEQAFADARLRAAESELDPDCISAFHADLKTQDKQNIQQRIRSGQVRVTFTTNALELGLDIGGLDGVILAGFPSNIMSAWQQIGRAGRSWDEEAFVLFYAMNDPIDNFFVGNIDAFLNKPLDELVAAPDNEELIDKHMPALVSETGGTLPEGADKILGPTFYARAAAVRRKPVKGDNPHIRMNLRGGVGRSHALKLGNDEIGTISESRRFREAYVGAIFPFFGRKYRVHAHEADAVVLREADPHHITEGRFHQVLSQNQVYDALGYGQFEIHYGAVDLWTNFSGYSLIEENSKRVIETNTDNVALPQSNLHSFRVDVPSGERVNPGISALEHMFRVGAMFVIPSDRYDTSTYSRASLDSPEVYVYENYSGGVGVAKSLFARWPESLRKGMEIAYQCPCRNGCQNCIEPAKSYDLGHQEIDKQAGLVLASELVAAFEIGADRRFDNGMMTPIQ